MCVFPSGDVSVCCVSDLESATGDLQSPVTPESINGTDERVTPDAAFNAESRVEINAVPFPHSSTSITKHWEAELAALKGNNAKLTAALLESTANVKQWKQQLAAYQEEAERLHKRVRDAQDRTVLVTEASSVTELECVSGQAAGIKTQKTELNQTIEELEAELKAKEEELEKLKEEVEKANQLQTQKDSLTQKLQVNITAVDLIMEKNPKGFITSRPVHHLTLMQCLINAMQDD
ncbi:hypothetical protein M9458_054384 [Cirrhinus mrigala]|uniref:Homer scaffold protein 1 n=1 Tax=Cirrhinus mrigala TaxID=683832 RepID=A0ABD0MNS0_CIRMR